MLRLSKHVLSPDEGHESALFQQPAKFIGLTRRSGTPGFAASVAVALGAIVICSATAAAEAPRLRGLLKQASVVVAAEVSDVTPYGDGRVSVARLRVSDVLKGKATGTDAAVVEMRDTPTPPIFRGGDYVVAFLRLAQRTTYLSKYLPEGRYYQLARGRSACLATSSPADAAVIKKLVGRVADTSRNLETGRSQQAKTARTLAFDLLAAPHALLVEDGTDSLSAIPDLAATLTTDEQQRIETALNRSDLPLPVRIALIRAVAANGLAQLVPALQGIRSPELIGASLDALARLGAARTEEELQDQLGSTESKTRIAAVQQLLRQEGAEAIPRVANLALRDPDAEVRVAAIQALGETKSADALWPLERIFADPSWDIRHATGRAIFQIGGRAATEALTRLAFNAPSDAQRYAVILLMVSGITRDDPLLARIVKTHPDESIRDLAEHGLDLDHH